MTTHEGTKRPTGARVEGPIKTHDGRFYWHRYAANGEEVAVSSESYEHRQHALDQAIAEAKAYGLRLFEPGYDSDQTEGAPDWVEVSFT